MGEVNSRANGHSPTLAIVRTALVGITEDLAMPRSRLSFAIFGVMLYRFTIAAASSVLRQFAICPLNGSLFIPNFAFSQKPATSGGAGVTSARVNSSSCGLLNHLSALYFRFSEVASLGVHWRHE